MNEAVAKKEGEAFEKKPSPKEAHVSKKKTKEVEELKKLFSSYDTIALVNLESLPSHQLQVMRKKIDEYAVIRVTKKRLIKKALEDVDKKGVKDLIESLKEVMPALIFSRENAFKLASLLRKNKSKVAARPGQKAPRDITINAGPTPFTPGPIIGELGSMGIKAAVEEGKIVVKEDAVVVKEGDEIGVQVADLLVKLDVKPMEIGLNLVAAYEDGLILNKDVLEFEESLYVDEIKKIASDAFKLTIGIGFVTKDNVIILIKKAESETKALIEVAGLITGDSVKKMLGKASKEAENVKGLVPDAPEETKPEEKESKEEKPKEEEKTEDLKKQIDEEKEGEKEKLLEKASAKKPSKDKMDTVIVDDKKEEKEAFEQKPSPKEEKEPEKVPTAEELAERKKQREEVEAKEEEKEEKVEENNVPSLQDLAEKPKEEKKEEEVPSAHELAERKKEDNADKEEN